MTLRTRQSAPSASHSGDDFLNLISNPFQSQIQVNSIYASLIWAFAVSGVLFLVFVVLRPKIPTVYAPRARQVDSNLAPRKLKNTAFGWTRAVRNLDEYDLADRIGMDAVVFLRFLRMLRNIFIIFAVLGCAILIPLNLVGARGMDAEGGDIAVLLRFTPQFVYGQRFWVYVLLAYSFQLVLFYFIWKNYWVVLDLRRRYFDSAEYRQSLTSRTLLLRYIPLEYRNEEGIAAICNEAMHSHDMLVPVPARDVHELPALISKHDHAVEQLEGYLAKYFAHAETTPDVRPQCKVEKDDRKEYGRVRLDAIEYLQQRIAMLRLQIDDARKSVDSRDATNYGFASFTYIEDVHATAFAAHKKSPRGTNLILAPSADDLIWRNLSMSRSNRRARIFLNGGCMLLLTIAYIPFNVLSSAFLSDFSKLGLFWSSFDADLSAHPVGWGVAQGIIAPLFQYLIFLGLPYLFRRLHSHAGDPSKTSLERHVMQRLYAFFVVNNLIVFSVFATGFRFLASVLEAKETDTWTTIKDTEIFSSLMAGLCDVSTFWLTYQMQQNLSAALDMAQLVPLLITWFSRRWTHQTPRQRLAVTKPRPLDYASYYNNYLFVATVGLCFGVLQPLIFPITAFYLTIETLFKRYTVQYVTSTATESGGLFWVPLINRLLLANLLANAVIALAVAAHADYLMLAAMLPLLLLTCLFKYMCHRLFTTGLRYASTTPHATDLEDWNGSFKDAKASHHITVHFAHPALHRDLRRPLVDARWEPRLARLLHPSLRVDVVDGAHGDVFSGQVVRPDDGTEEKSETLPPMRVLRAPFEPLEPEAVSPRTQHRAELRDAYGEGETEAVDASRGSSRCVTPSRLIWPWETDGTRSRYSTAMDEQEQEEEEEEEEAQQVEEFEEIHVGPIRQARSVSRGTGRDSAAVADIEAARVYAEEFVRAGRSHGARGA